MNKKELIEHAKAIREYCSNTYHCKDCPFDHNYSCTFGVSFPEEWDLKPYITEDEKTILKHLDPEIKYLARDKNGELWGHNQRPRRFNDGWTSNGRMFNLKALHNAFSFITWEEDCYAVEDLLEE